MKKISKSLFVCSKLPKKWCNGHKSTFWSSNFHFSRIAPLFWPPHGIQFPLPEFLHGLKRQFSDQNRAKSTPRYSIYYNIYYNICIYYNIYYNICIYYNIYYNIYYTARPGTDDPADLLRVTMKKFSRARNFRSGSRETRSAGHKSMFWSSNFHFSHNAPLFSPRKKIYGGWSCLMTTWGSIEFDKKPSGLTGSGALCAKIAILFGVPNKSNFVWDPKQKQFYLGSQTKAISFGIPNKQKKRAPKWSNFLCF